MSKRLMGREVPARPCPRAGAGLGDRPADRAGEWTPPPASGGAHQSALAPKHQQPAVAV